MRNYRRMTLLLGVLILLLSGGTYFLLKGDKIEERKTRILDLDQGKSPTSIKVEHSGGNYTIMKSENCYKVVELENVLINEGLAENIFERLTDITSTGETSGGGSREKEQGFKNPILTITFEFNEEGSTVLQVGSSSQVLEGYFSRVKGREEKVYILEKSLIETLPKSKETFRDTALFDFIYESDYLKLSKIRIDGGNIVPLVVEWEEVEYVLREPVAKNCSQTALKEKILHPLMHLRGDNYEGTTLTSEMGFSSPQYTCSIWFGGEEIQVLVGNEIGSSTYIKRADKDEVYLIDTAKIAFINTDYREVITEEQPLKQ